MTEPTNKKDNRTPKQRFKEDAASYVNQTVGKLEKLASYGRSGRYEYTEKQVKDMTKHIRAEVGKMKTELLKRFDEPKKEEPKNKGFSF